MFTEMLQLAVVISILSGMIRIATPILLAALGELVGERAGVLNLGVEGIMLMGAYVGFLAAHQSGSIILGLLAAMLAGALMGLIMVFMAATLKVDQTVTGLGLNLLAAGISFYWYRVAFKALGTESIPSVSILKIIPIPGLAQIPVMGEVLFEHNVLTYFAFLMVPAVWFFLYRTKYGLEIRAAGENPRAIDMKGVNLYRLQYFSLLFAGSMGGLGGAFLTLGSAGIFVPDISAGRGWLALVLIIAGNWHPVRIMLAGLLFSFLDAFQLQAQGLGVDFPYQILLALPYLVAILLMVVSRARSEAPSCLGVPYMRE